MNNKKNHSLYQYNLSISFFRVLAHTSSTIVKISLISYHQISSIALSKNAFKQIQVILSQLIVIHAASDSLIPDSLTAISLVKHSHHLRTINFFRN